MNTTENQSLANILQHSVRIQSNTIIRQDRRVQSYCGLQLKGIGASILSRKQKEAINVNQQTPQKELHLRQEELRYPIIISVHRHTNVSTVMRPCGMKRERVNKGSRFVNPSFSLCCKEGKIQLPKFNPTPQPLHNLLNYNDPATARFRDQIRVYNSMFSYTSFRARIDHLINNRRGVYTFRVNGQSYHRIGSLLPKEGTQPRYAQLWFFDTENEVSNHMRAFIDTDNRDGVDAATMHTLTQMLDQYSLVAKAFRMARNWCHSHASVNVELHLLSERTNARQYNKPTVAEVAALITNDFGDETPSINILVNKLHSGPKRISELHPTYMALQYPLLFLYGEDGFHDKIPYYTNSSHRKTNRDLYHNVCDAVTRGDTNAAGLGQRIVLPRTFVGGPRYMMQNYQDAMALCRTYGNPDLFITFTSNPKWPEISEMLTYFSHYLSVVYVIEFQKQGLSNAHILLWLEENSKCKTATQIDDIISAELPSPMEDPEGYKVVTDYMLHGPYDGYPIYRHWENKVSFKNGKFTFDNRHVVPNNRYLLLKYQAHINVEWRNRSKVIKYLCKYLNKGPDRATIVIQENVQKGDHVTSEKIMAVDEINNYLNCRYLAPCEAAWQLFSFDIHYLFPDEVKLPSTKSKPSHVAGLRILTSFARKRRGPKDFDELMTVNNRLCHTFKEACFAYGLLNVDREWTKAIAEASLWALGPQLRDLFVTILLFCDISRPLKLWKETCEYLSEDILHRKRKLYDYPQLQLSIEQIQNYCLVEIHKLLNRNERSLTEFQDLPRPNPQLLTNMDNRLIREALNFDMNKNFNQWVLSVGNDTVPAKAKDGEDEPSWIQIPEQFIINSSDSPIESIVAGTYPNFIERQHDEEYLKERAILTLRNDDVDEINTYMFKKLAGKSVTYNSADEVCKASTESLDQQ
ncbi:DNA helicase PIF1, ATP-dependent [Tanacetum coccineum]